MSIWNGICIGALLSVFCAVSLANADDSSKSFKVVCYLGSWANYREGKGKFLIEDIDPGICTHLVYAFAKLENGEIKPYDPYLDLKENWGLGAFQRFNALREKNSKLKTLIAIGGWNEGSTKYSAMASSAAARKKFIDSCISFLQKYGFDGIDMDWEYPANRGGKPEDKKNFALLLKEMRESFDPHGFLLTAAVSAGKSTIDSAYDVPAMSRYLDFFSVMAYDFHGGWDKTTGLNAPLYPRSEERDSARTLNVDYAIKYYLKKGAPASKVVLGMGLYGRSFTLRSSEQNSLGADIVGKGRAGPYTREDGMLGYNEICEMMKAGNGWTAVFNDEHMAPYAYKDRQWVGYDDKKSTAIKVNYIKKMNLGGGMVWSIETDDFRGLCDGTRYPLLKTIFEGLNGDREIDDDSSTPRPESIATSPTENDINFRYDSTASKSTTKTMPLTSTPGSSVCTKEGYMRDPNDCKKFMYCQRTGDSEFTKYDYNCGPGTVFSNDLLTCVYPYQEPECQE